MPSGEAIYLNDSEGDQRESWLVAYVAGQRFRLINSPKTHKNCAEVAHLMSRLCTDLLVVERERPS